MSNFFTHPPGRLIFHLTYHFNVQLLYNFQKAFQYFIIYRVYFPNKRHFESGCVFEKFMISTNIFKKVMVQDFRYFQKKMHVYLFPAEYVIHIGTVAMQLFGKLGNAHILLIKYFLDSFSDVDFFCVFVHFL